MEFGDGIAFSLDADSPTGKELENDEGERGEDNDDNGDDDDDDKDV